MVNFRDLSNQSPAASLQRGARMNQAEFHKLYCEMPAGYKAELIEGMVFEPPHPFVEHGEGQAHLSAIFLAYAGNVKGLQVLTDTTVILSDLDVLQPDVIMRILPNYGGQSQNLSSKAQLNSATFGTFLKGAPELVVEVSHRSKPIDLGTKKNRYQAAGVLEYLVYSLEPKQLYWFDLKANQQLSIETDGTLRSSVFPGLWVHQEGLFDYDYPRLISMVNAGLQTNGFKKFAAQITKVR
ncbi:MAG: Uma2 family endonuclease [Candidatus Obscuribacterales bacterium]|nr:Uma2 family endonuclease [Candidatus Obscuribacterales bacterium]